MRAQRTPPSASPMVPPLRRLPRRLASHHSRLRRPGPGRSRLPAPSDSQDRAGHQQISRQPPNQPACRLHRHRLQARFLRCRRPVPVISVGRRLPRGHGPVPLGACRAAARDRLGVVPACRAPVTTRSRLLRAWASRAHLALALPSQLGPVGRGRNPAARPCREVGQVCPACRGQIPQ